MTRSTRPGFATSVVVEGPLTETLEGAERGPAHFRGVATVVTKLLNMAGPDVAYFGQKDAQQALVISKIVGDLDIPTRIEIVPTVREPDGLALSSRNVRLVGEKRTQALALSAGLDAARRAVAAGERDARVIGDAARTAMAQRGVTPEYVALVRPTDLQPVQTLTADTLVAIAARVGDTRLIDNTIVSPTSDNEVATLFS